MADIVAIALRFMHIVFAIFWIGAVSYTVFVVRTAMQRVGMPARRETMRQLIPVAIHFVPMSAVSTIVIGALLYLVMGAFSLDSLIGTRWGQTLLVASALAVATFAFGMAVVIRAAKRILGHLDEEACGHADLMARLQRVFNRGQVIVLILGLVVLALMVTASRGL